MSFWVLEGVTMWPRNRQTGTTVCSYQRGPETPGEFVGPNSLEDLKGGLEAFEGL